MAEYLLADHARCVSMAECAVLLDTRTGKFHSLNRIGSDLVRAIRNGESLDIWAARTADTYGLDVQRVARDGDVFVQSLLEIGVLTREPLAR